MCIEKNTVPRPQKSRTRHRVFLAGSLALLLSLDLVIAPAAMEVAVRLATFRMLSAEVEVAPLESLRVPARNVVRFEHTHLFSGVREERAYRERRVTGAEDQVVVFILLFLFHSDDNTPPRPILATAFLAML